MITIVIKILTFYFITDYSDMVDESIYTIIMTMNIGISVYRK